MMQALMVAAAQRYHQNPLSVRVANPARHFCARLGFVEAATMKHRVGGDFIVMTLDLHPGGRGSMPAVS